MLLIKCKGFSFIKYSSVSHILEAVLSIMKQYQLCVIFLSIPSFCFAVSGQIEQPPNVVVFLADDMGLIRIGLIMQTQCSL